MLLNCDVPVDIISPWKPPVCASIDVAVIVVAVIKLASMFTLLIVPD